MWPEALLGAVTLGMVGVDGLNKSGGDPGFYYKVAEQVAQGLVPYRDFPLEYPPVALPAMLVPYFLPGGSPSLETYLAFLFSSNVVLLVAVGVTVVWLARRGWSTVSTLRSVAVYALLALTLAPVVLWRFDALPTLLTVLALAAVVLHRPVASGIALGAAIVAKLYPLAVLPVLFIGQIRHRRLQPAILLGLAAVATAAAIVAPFVLGAGSSAFYWVGYATGRGTQVESGPGALALLANVLGGPSARIYPDFGTWQVDSPMLAVLGPLWAGLTVLLLAALGLALWKRGRVDQLAIGELRPTSHITYIVAALMVVIVTSRVLSPQYLFWVVPFAALDSRPKSLVFWICCLLTTYVYALNYQEFLNQETYAVVATNIRNVILMAFTIWVIAPDLGAAIRELYDRVRMTLGRSGRNSASS